MAELVKEDLRCLREAKEAEKNAPTVGIAETEETDRRGTSGSGRRGKVRG